MTKQRAMAAIIGMAAGVAVMFAVTTRSEAIQNIIAGSAGSHPTGAIAAAASHAQAEERVASAPPQLLPPVIAESQGRSVTPPALVPIVGHLVLKGAGPALPAITAFDQRMAQSERDRFTDFLACENTCFVGSNHYGGLMARLAWAIRTGEAIGPAAVDESRSAYARGRRIVRRYLQYSKRNRFAVQPHNNTGIPDIEALYVLEGDKDALDHIHVTAMNATTDRYNYLKLRNKNSDVRQITVALQALMAAIRQSVPFERNPANTSMGFDPSPGSWKAVGDTQIDWLSEYAVVKPDGSIPSPSHNGNEAYLFNAWLATELLRWCRDIEWRQDAFDTAKLIMDHVLAAQKPGWATLGYQSNSREPAPDLAAFYVWPSLVLWQETGDPEYREFALANIVATRRSYIRNIKQWNQTFSTRAQNAEALLAGVPWR